MKTAFDEAALAPLENISEPKWWTGTPAIDPTMFVIDALEFRDGISPLTPSQALERRMSEVFDRVGLVHVVNTGLNDLESMRLIATQVLKTTRKYEGELIRGKLCKKMFTRSEPPSTRGYITITKWLILGLVQRCSVF